MKYLFECYVDFSYCFSYIVVQVVPKDTQTKVLYLKEQVLAKCLLSHVQKYYGIYGVGLLEHGFRVKYCNERTKIAMLRCSHHSYRFVTSILPFITRVSAEKLVNCL